MNLENTYFKNEYTYNAKFVNNCIVIVRTSPKQKRVRAYKNLIFKMMKDIVKKNVSNYLNLLKCTYRKDSLPTRDEVIADCYVIFDKCLDKFKVNCGYNFYFYFNKSLSRNFFRYYQRELQRSNGVKVTEALMTVNTGFHERRSLNTTDMLIDNLGVSDTERRICESRLRGQKTSEFLAENTDMNSNQYSKHLKNIKRIIKIYQEKGEL